MLSKEAPEEAKAWLQGEPLSFLSSLELHETMVRNLSLEMDV